MPISKWDTAPNNVHYSIEALGINTVNSIVGFQDISYGIIWGNNKLICQYSLFSSTQLTNYLTRNCSKLLKNHKKKIKSKQTKNDDCIWYKTQINCQIFEKKEKLISNKVIKKSTTMTMTVLYTFLPGCCD